jgi:two-component system response regulator DevR
MKRTRVLIIEDDPFWQKKLLSDLQEEPTFEMLGIASAKDEAMKMIETHKPDVILVDLNLTENNLDGLDITKEVTLSFSSIHVIILTSIQERDIIIRSFQRGASNFISKGNYHDIVRAIHDASSGKLSIHADSAEILRDEIRLSVLSKMEREIYELRKEGFNKVEIASKLYKSINTIKTQFKRIKDKLDQL